MTHEPTDMALVGLLDRISATQDLLVGLGKQAVQMAAEEWLRLGVGPATEDEYELHIEHEGLQIRLHSSTNLPHGVNVLGVGQPDCFGNETALLVRCTGYDEYEPLAPWAEQEQACLDYEERTYWVGIDDISEPDCAAKSIYGTMCKLIYERSKS